MTPEELFSKILSEKDVSDKVARIFEIGLLVKDRVVGYFPYSIPEKFLGSVGIIFPVKNLYGEVVSFYLRRPNNVLPKYDSLPFEKTLLFALDKTFPFIYRNGAIVVEGPFDVFTLISNGILNVCALLGTNINTTQICLLRRFTKKCIVMLDGDSMGRTKSIDVFNKFKEFDFEPEVVYLPTGYDPDSYIKTYGKERFNEILVNS